MLNTERFQIGIIEGFFGQPWSWDDRADHADFLAARGYAFYIYAPKGDPYLRKAWQTDWPETHWTALKALRKRYAQAGVAFGILGPHLVADRGALRAERLECPGAAQGRHAHHAVG